MPTPEEHARQRQLVAKAAARAAASQWAQVDQAAIARSWASQLPTVTALVTAAQFSVADEAEDYLDEYAPPADVRVQPSAFAGRASDGGGLSSLLYQPAITALTSIGSGADVGRALAGGRASLDMIVRTQVADAGRAADQIALTGRKQVQGYVRQIVGATCARCTILAGRFYRWNAGFQRHPRCDCIHVPSNRAQWREVGRFHDPRQVYDSLTVAERQRAGWSLADQEAIAAGADLIKVTNMRGVTTAGTRRSLGRMTPDQIYKRAGGDRDEAIRLLRSQGYLTSTPVVRPVPRTLDERFAAAATDRAALRAAPANAGRRETGNVAVTRSEQAALRDYISNFFVAINGNLRRGTVSEFLDRTVGRIDGVLARSALRRDVLVWRGMQDAGRLFGDRLGGNLAGFEWRELGYVSTSANRAVAQQFMVDNGDRVLMRMLVPRGTQAVQLSPWSEFAFGSQSELLLRRGLRLRVVRDRGVSPQGYRLVDVEVVP